jgi:hypothetical protein
LIYTGNESEHFFVKVRSKDEVFSCEKEVSATSPCLLKDLPKGELTVEMRAGKRAAYEKSFQMQDTGVEIKLTQRGGIRKFVLLTSMLFVGGSVLAAVENSGNTWVIGLPFVGGAFWSVRAKHRPWSKVTVTPSETKVESPDDLSLGESQVVP